MNDTTFAGLKLNAHLLRGLETQKLTTPTPVQAQAIPAALAGGDVMACAPTGTGKTGAFVLPSLHRILAGPSKTNGRGPRLLVLTPTRELAQQVLMAVKNFGGSASIRIGVIVGGVNYGPQFQLLRGQLDVLVATPGRLIDHLNEGKIDFSRCEMVVLDEADKMLDMGFKQPVEKILSAVNTAAGRPQTLLFSATFTKAVEQFAQHTLQQPTKIQLAHVRHETTQIEQHAFRADDAAHKQAILDVLLKDMGEGQTIVFSATKHGADKLALKLQQRGHASAALHGGMRQNVRKRVLDQMHQKKVRVLVATDVAARGIDVKQLSQVINFDLPQAAEDYVHRIGRTGRAGETGKAISLISPSDVPMLRDIEKLLGKKIELAQLPGLEPQMDAGEFARQGAAAPRSRQGQNRGRQGGGGYGGGGQHPAARRMSESRGSGFGDRPRFERGSRDGARSEGRSEGAREERVFRNERPAGRASEGRREGGHGGRSFGKPQGGSKSFSGPREDNRRSAQPAGRPKRDFA